MKISVLMAALLVLATGVSGAAIAADARVGTWNTMRLGNGDQKSYPALAAVAANVDVLAVQEVMNDEGIQYLKLALEQRTREKWSSLCSSPVGSRNYKEQYCFLSRDSAVQYEDGAVSFLDRKHVFMREPYSARFKSLSDGKTFALATVHIIYGKSAADRTPELKELGNYWEWLEQVYPGEPIMLMGDFNMPPSDPAFESLRTRAIPMVTDGASTLSNTSGRFANLYDNVFANQSARSMMSGVGIVNYPLMLKVSHEDGRRAVSDHAPVFFQLGKARLGSAVQMAYPQGPNQQVRRVEIAQARNDSVITPRETSGAAAVAKASNTQAGSVHGNKNSHIYHLSSGCPSYGMISEQNLVVFGSEAEAVASNYRKAGNCR
ncbi:endonuclease/exonuclease/phosphatase family protein (plasmid) [Pseudomonas amygdali pv. lachrymans]|uniref:endonuclease/exonuclease/phosphatase family protein n=1 Tax=Pseudomonas amygdali TaxID=47877 RepID=UPI000A57FA84|nr:endonuclease/exonuclease/phosphatase family protein [Pseudomonas amygdali]RMM39318.1 hypothetical protein ALQ79_200279 [Pseudomonas amygdali pv. lachrymans]WIO61246.1 endonuclease/exonuclease/phosphatase family protein [Pseudomonas amygdali pv. lachrymans]